MKTMKFNLSVFFIIVLFTAASFGQNQNNAGNDKVKYNTWSATLSGGSMLFYGDLRQYDFYPLGKTTAQPSDVSERKWGFGLALNKQLSPVFALQGQLQIGKLSGIKRKVDAYFNASFTEYGINGILNFRNLFFPNAKNCKITVYGIAGIGLIDFKSLQRSISTGDTIHSYGYGQYGQKNEATSEIVIPLGLGVKYKINKKFDIGIESTINNVNTDKLDARIKTGTAKDKYGYTALTLTYKIGKNEKSLEWTAPKEMDADALTPLLSKMNRKIDSIGNKLKEVDGKTTQLQSDVAVLKNPPAEADDDGDGVPNKKDLEPNTPKGSYVDVNGRAIPVSKDNNMTTTVTSASAEEAKPLFSVFFAVNSAVVDELNEEKIAMAAVILKQDPSIKLDLVGHADKTGGKAFNEILSKKRAQAVYDILIKSYGIDAGRLNVVGAGTNEPLSKDFLNVERRVDFFIKK